MASVTFRGLDPRTSYARWGLLAVAAGIIIGSTAPGVAQAATLELRAHPENIPWHVERIVAFLAYFALFASVTLGLLASTRLLDTIAHRPVTVMLHKELAAVGLGLGGIHGVLLGLDHSMPFSLTQIAVPFAAPYAPLFVGVGQIALYLMLAVVASFYVRARIGPKTWRRLHYLSFLAFVAATVHGIGAGTDSASSWAAAAYVAAGTVTAFLLTFRVTTAVGSRIGERWSRRRARQLVQARAVFGDADAMLLARRTGADLAASRRTADSAATASADRAGPPVTSAGALGPS